MQRIVFLQVILIALVVSIFQSEPLQELINLRTESMPVFATEVGGPYRRLDNIPMDGRLIRVAMVGSPNPKFTPLLEHTFPSGLSYLRDEPSLQRENNSIDPFCSG